MNQWAFVIAAYGVTFGGLAAVSIYLWRAMNSAEKRAENLQKGRGE